MPERLKHYREFISALPDQEAAIQGARCIDCGTPFCQTGCPVNNIIPDWNDLVYRGDWKQAIESLHSTDNFPEFTSRVCPAPCEAACTLNTNSDPVAIRAIERPIIDKAWEMGWVQPQPAQCKTGKRVAVRFGRSRRIRVVSRLITRLRYQLLGWSPWLEPKRPSLMEPKGPPRRSQSPPVTIF